MKSLIKIIPVLFVPILLTSGTIQMPFHLSSVVIKEEAEGIKLIGSVYLALSKPYDTYGIVAYVENSFGKEQMFIYRERLSRPKFYYFSNEDKLFPYDKLDENNRIIIECGCTIEGYQREIIALNYSPSKFAKKEIEFTELDNDRTLSNGYVMEYYNATNGGYKRLQDQITISNFEDIHIVDIYKCFDVSFIKFRYQNGESNIPNGSFFLELYDSKNLFPAFDLIGDTMYRKIPLSINENEGIYTFSFMDDLYYDPSTFITSLNKKDGYIKTPYLFMPKNHFDDLNNIKCRLIFNINSHLDYVLKSSFSIKFIKRYFGDCYDSEYCVETSEDNNENYREKIVEVHT